MERVHELSFAYDASVVCSILANADKMRLSHGHSQDVVSPGKDEVKDSKKENSS